MADMTPTESERNEEVRQVEAKKDAYPKTFLVYRDNDFYHEAIPALANQLRASGFEVGIIAFPAGTPEDQITQELETQEEDFRGGVVLTDGTVEKNWFNPKYQQLKSKGIEVNPNPTMYIKGDLDNRFSRGVIDAVVGLGPEFAMFGGELTDEQIEALGGNEARWAEYWLETHGKAYTNLFKTAFQKEKPDWITIAPARLTDHQPFDQYESLRQKQEAEGKEVKVPQDYLKQWIVEAGFPSDNVLYGRKTDHYLKEIPPGANVWEIADRHTRQGNMPVPMENFVQNLQARGLINNNDISPEALSKSVAERIEKDIKVVIAAKESTNSNPGG